MMANAFEEEAEKDVRAGRSERPRTSRQAPRGRYDPADPDNVPEFESLADFATIIPFPTGKSA
jgi:hypothetical protein